MTDREKYEFRKFLSKDLMSYYYKRNKILKFFYFLIALLTLTYVIYGIVVFFKGKYFNVWLNNN